MVENSPLDISTWIRRFGPDFKDSIGPYGFSCVFPYHQIRVVSPFFMLLPIIGFLLGMFSASME